MQVSWQQKEDEKKTHTQQLANNKTKRQKKERKRRAIYKLRQMEKRSQSVGIKRTTTSVKTSKDYYFCLLLLLVLCVCVCVGWRMPLLLFIMLLQYIFVCFSFEAFEPGVSWCAQHRDPDDTYTYAHTHIYTHVHESLENWNVVSLLLSFTCFIKYI